ncbi:threonine/serine ThrE exporter family protein [Rhizobium tubonense]|nr:threonine/serine exporter family protein [Rhizobium tubonense]
MSRPVIHEARPPGIDPVSHFILKTARLLLISGADAEYVRRRTKVVVSRLGLSAEIFLSGEGLLLMIDAGTSYRTRIGPRIAGMGANTGLFDAVEGVTKCVVAGSMDLSEALGRLEALEGSPVRYPAWLIIPAVAGTMAALCRLFGGEWSVVLAAFLAGLVSTLLRQGFSARHLNSIVSSFTTALVSAVVAALVLRLMSTAPTVLAFVAAGMILVPGVPLINGIADMASGHTGIASFRLALGTVTVVAIGFALFLAANLVGEPLTVDLATAPIPVWQDFCFSGVAAFGFAILFNCPARAILACVVCGMVSHGLRSELGALGLDLATATLTCSFIAGLIAHSASGWLSLPWPTFAFPGTVAMIPGSYVFRASVGGLEIMAKGVDTPPAILAESASVGISALVLTAAVGVGLLVASSLAGIVVVARHRSDTSGAD